MSESTRPFADPAVESLRSCDDLGVGEGAKDSTLREIVRRLVEALHPMRVYLFGSRARGDHSDDSDYDLLLVVDTTPDQIYHLETLAYGAMWGVGVSVDIVVMPDGHFRRRLTVVASLPATVVREGRLLYSA